MATQAEFALNMIRQLRLLDPSVSAEVGTPERKIIDTVAEQLATAQIDLTQLNSAFDLESKFGVDLDEFLSIFGFARQTGSFATGYVTFSRAVASSVAIPIQTGTQVAASAVATTGGGSVSLNFATTAYGELTPGELEVTIPVRCTTTGSIGNIAAGTITSFGSSPVLGITGVSNAIATTGGTDPETDAALKVRFKNTVFRNLAGTEDQFLALAISTAFTSKANAVGPISRYQEYVQVPDVDDATADPDSGIVGNGSAGEWTSALSTIPYSKHIYDTLPYYLTTGELTDAETGFYRREVDFKINTTIVAKNRGDTYRQAHETIPSGYNVESSSFTTYQPNLTFFNVFQGTNEAVTALRPKDVLLFEHSYMSSASRNDYEHQLLNCVDVFINGQNPVQADAITVRPGTTYAATNAFSTEATNRFYIENFRRIGEPERRPVAGNFFMGLFWTPVLTIPSKIVTPQATYYEGVHYWAVEDVSSIGRSIRARTGIEWNATVKGQTSGDGNANYNGAKITENPAEAIEITGYTYDRNIVDLQATLEANKQITSDVLAHQSEVRRFKLDLTIMYTPGFSVASVNSAIQSAVATFFDGKYFGTTVQLSDILQTVHNVAGVDNVRWSRDVLEADGYTQDKNGNPRYRVVEVDDTGNPLTNFMIDRKTYGSTTSTEVQVGYFTGLTTGGSFFLYYELSGVKVEFGASAASIKSALEAKSVPITSVSGSGTPTSPYIFTFSAVGYRPLMTVKENFLTSSLKVPSTTAYNSDFFLYDNQLPALPSEALSTDTLPGLILRRRAQNTWGQL